MTITFVHFKVPRVWCDSDHAPEMEPSFRLILRSIIIHYQIILNI